MTLATDPHVLAEPETMAVCPSCGGRLLDGVVGLRVEVFGGATLCTTVAARLCQSCPVRLAKVTTLGVPDLRRTG